MSQLRAPYVSPLGCYFDNSIGKNRNLFYSETEKTEPWSAMHNFPLPSEAELKAVVPARCFEVNVWRSSFYLCFDLIVMTGLFVALAHTQNILLQSILIFFIGMMGWALFMIGHDAGHGTFAKDKRINTAIGLFTYGVVLSPYRPLQRSHSWHHLGTGHLQKEENFRAVRYQQDYGARKILYRSGIFLLLGWPAYIFGFRNIGDFNAIKASHILTTSNLYAPHIRWSWLASLAVVGLFSLLYVSVGIFFGWAAFVKFVVLPYFSFCVWLSFVTYMNHIAPEVPIYDSADWTRLKGALSTVDRTAGPVINWLTHNVINCHVIHHIYPTIPHYRLKEATKAVIPLLGPHYLKSDRFIIADFIRTQIGCHYVEKGQGYEVWKSAYNFAPNAGSQHPR